jgi:SAM-dependent methyltransferase
MRSRSKFDYDADAFRRLDESDDARFYEQDRFVDHLDTTALKTVGRIIGTLVIEEEPVILDLMAGWNSHLPETVRATRVVGLGLNANELARNPALSESVIHDLNRDPRLPFPDASFDVVLNTVSVDYMTRPIEVFREVARVLKPGGLYLVIFSNRMFPEKAVKIWLESSESLRVDLVRAFFDEAGNFEDCRIFASGGRPRPEDDRHTSLGLLSDPVWAVYAERKGGSPDRVPRPEVPAEEIAAPDPREVERRKKLARETLCCPHCNQSLTRWKVPDSPFIEWDADYVYVCFNKACPYTVRSWEVMQRQGNVGFAYRLMYHRERDRFYCVPDVGFHSVQV